MKDLDGDKESVRIELEYFERRKNAATIPAKS
jgi:hypothetical protein